VPADPPRPPTSQEALLALLREADPTATVKDWGPAEDEVLRVRIVLASGAERLFVIIRSWLEQAGRDPQARATVATLLRAALAKPASGPAGDPP
jgi:hypothetical protein